MNRSIRNSLTFVNGLLFAAIFAVLAIVPMRAQTVDDIKVHFPAEVAVPGHLLAPGAYVFHRLNADNPNVYEILADDGASFIGFIHVMPTERGDRGNTEVELSKPDVAGVRLLQAWYGPGETDGYALSYSEKEVRTLDKWARTPVQSSAAFAGRP